MLSMLPNQAEAGALVAPAGTIIPFANTTAPNGWALINNASVTDASMRLNPTTGGSAGGSITWSSWNFGGTFNLNAFTISVAQLPAHNHAVNDPGHGHGVNDPGHSHSYTYTNILSSGASGGAGFQITGQSGVATSTDATGVTVAAALSNITTANTGSGSSITPNITTPQVKYIDFIVASKL
jgi:hypothetical protein